MMDEAELCPVGEVWDQMHEHQVNQVTPLLNVLDRNWHHLSWHGSDLGFNPGSSLSGIKELNQTF